jgi:hypothetical protein
MVAVAMCVFQDGSIQTDLETRFGLLLTIAKELVRGADYTDKWRERWRLRRFISPWS